MDDEERLKNCQREIFRLRNVVRCLENGLNQFRAELEKELAKGDHLQEGLLQALEIWRKVMEEE